MTEITENNPHFNKKAFVYSYSTLNSKLNLQQQMQLPPAVDCWTTAISEFTFLTMSSQSPRRKLLHDFLHPWLIVTCSYRTSSLLCPPLTPLIVTFPPPPIALITNRIKSRLKEVDWCIYPPNLPSHLVYKNIISNNHRPGLCFHQDQGCLVELIYWTSHIVALTN
jgi:hypothetical protein